MTQLFEAQKIIREVLQLNNSENGFDNSYLGAEVKVSAKQSKEIQAKIIEKFGCSKQTAYYYYFYRGKKALTKDRDIKFVTDRSSPKKKKTADDVVAEQLANLKKEPVSPFRI
tara:strand:- start:124 stop:462 length:339 start_codon:yes stop_codon:yes gene_type:complete